MRQALAQLASHVRERATLFARIAFLMNLVFLTSLYYRWIVIEQKPSPSMFPYFIEIPIMIGLCCIGLYGVEFPTCKLDKIIANTLTYVLLAVFILGNLGY
jgi:hypothetical protein